MQQQQKEIESLEKQLNELKQENNNKKSISEKNPQQEINNMSMTENYKASACIKELLDNTLNNFEIYLDVEEISEYIQSSLIKDLFISQNYKENKSYEIDTIKNMLINNSKNK